MRILYVITDLNEGGAENALGQIAMGLSSAGHLVRVVCLFGGDGDVAVRLRSSQIPVDCIGCERSWQILRLRRLSRIIREFRPDIIHSWLFHANLACRLLAPRHIPITAGLRVVEPRKSHILLDRWTRGRVARYICVSPEVAAFACDIMSISPDQCDIIENGIDVDAFQAARGCERQLDAIRGLSVARVTEQKGLDILIRGLARLPDDIVWTWRFVGSMPDRRYAGQLRDLAETLKISDRIEWCGAVSRPEIVRFYAESNLFALPSRWEGQPNVVFEAMAAGVPVIAASSSGIADVAAAAPQALYVVADNRPDAWCTGIMESRRHPERVEQQIQAASNVVSTRTWARAVSQHLALYGDVLGDGSVVRSHEMV